MYQYDQRPGTQFSENAQKFMSEIQQSEYAVLCGRNNCGKSYLLKTLRNQGVSQLDFNFKEKMGLGLLL